MKVKEWVWKEQRKHHRCQCGCGQFIIIKRHHYFVGIPKIINRHFTEKMKNKISITRSGQCIGNNNHMFGVNTFGKNNLFHGRKHTEKSKFKMSIAKIGTKLSEERVEKLRMRRGPLSTNWKGGISFLPYCNKFNNDLKNFIRNRDNNICQKCGKTTIENKERLSVHHIHYDKENCNPDLITLCRICNINANKYRDWYEIYYLRKLVFRNLAKITSLNDIEIENYGDF